MTQSTDAPIWTQLNDLLTVQRTVNDKVTTMRHVLGVLQTTLAALDNESIKSQTEDGPQNLPVAIATTTANKAVEAAMWAAELLENLTD